MAKSITSAATEAWASDALDTAIRAAHLANPIITAPDGRQHALLPGNFHLTPIPERYKLPPYPVQRVTVDDRASLSSYANRFKSPSSLILANYDNLTISARLDWHPDNAQQAFGESGQDQHSVTLALRPSEEFKRWDELEGNFTQQAEFAAFMEENSVDITFPEAAVMVEISRDLEATTDQSFKSAIRLDNGDRSFRFETETRAENNVVVPREFTLAIPIYNGEPPTELRAAFRWRPTGQGLLLAFEWRRVEYQRRAQFEQIAFQAAEETGLPVFIGRQG